MRNVCYLWYMYVSYLSIKEVKLLAWVRSSCDKWIVIYYSVTLRYWFCNKFIPQFFFRLVEEEEISCEVKAEFKEKTKENSKLQKTIKGQEEEIQRLKEAIEFRDNFLAVSLCHHINLQCSQLGIFESPISSLHPLFSGCFSMSWKSLALIYLLDVVTSMKLSQFSTCTKVSQSCVYFSDLY